MKGQAHLATTEREYAAEHARRLRPRVRHALTGEEIRPPRVFASVPDTPPPPAFPNLTKP